MNPQKKYQRIIITFSLLIIVFASIIGLIITTLSKNQTLPSIETIENKTQDSQLPVKQRSYVECPPDRSFDSIEEALINPTKVCRLDLDGDLLTQVPTRIVELVHLKELNLSNNNITVLPEDIGSLKDLELLDLAHNPIEFLPSGFSNLSNLQWLRLSGHRFYGLPEEIYQLTNLDSLYIASPVGNHVDYGVTEELGSLNRLQTLNLHLASRRDNYNAALCKLTNLKSLSIAVNYNLEVLPCISELDKLESMNISFNELKHVPSELGNLPALKVLYLSNNQLSKIPVAVCKANKLEELYLQDNPLALDSQYQDELTKECPKTKIVFDPYNP